MYSITTATLKTPDKADKDLPPHLTNDINKANNVQRLQYFYTVLDTLKLFQTTTDRINITLSGNIYEKGTVVHIVQPLSSYYENEEAAKLTSLLFTGNSGKYFDVTVQALTQEEKSFT